MRSLNFNNIPNQYNNNIIGNTVNNDIIANKETSLKTPLESLSAVAADNTEDGRTICKVIFLFLFIIANFSIGLIPVYYRSKASIKSLKHFVGFANTFGAAVGLASAMFLILPRATDNISEYFTEGGGEKAYGHIMIETPWALVVCFFAYALALVFQKILFASMSAEEKAEEPLLEPQTQEEKEKQEDENEQAFKNVVGSRGRFGTFMGIRNLRKSLAKEGEELKIKTKGSIIRASLLISKSMVRDDFNKNNLLAHTEEADLFVNPKKIDASEDHKKTINEHKHDEENEGAHSHAHGHGSKSRSTTPLIAYLLLGAISFHGFFQGFTIGVENTLKESIVLGVCFLLHKSFESLSIGMILKEAGLNHFSYISMVLLFISFTPFGILVGLLGGLNKMVNGLFLGICVGALIYQCVSENIVQEFTFTQYRYTKFLIFIGGLIFVAGLVCIISI